MAEKRHFLTLMDLSSAELRDLIERATELKALRYAGTEPQSLSGKSLAMIFTKASTRTRVSFEAGITQLGGSALFLSGQDTQLGRGEPIEDAARVISSMVDAVMIRTYAHSDVERFAAHSTVPVINGLTDDFHPCQILADLQTFFELRGDISGRKVCWLGDGNNVCHSWMNAARLLDFELVISCPEGYEPDQDTINFAESKNLSKINISHNATKGVTDADAIYTDVWASMGQKEEIDERVKIFSPFQVNDALIANAKDDYLFMHCLPAERGREVTDSVIDSENSVVFEQAENRLHTQNAIMVTLCDKI